MKTLSLILLFAVALIVPSSFAADLSTEAGFIAAYKQAYQAKDAKQFEALACFESVDAKKKAEWLEGQVADATGKIKSLKIVAGAPKDLPTEFAVDGVTYGPNVPLTHTLTIELEPDGKTVEHSSMLGISQRKGRFCLPVTIAKKK